MKHYQPARVFSFLTNSLEQVLLRYFLLPTFILLGCQAIKVGTLMGKDIFNDDLKLHL